MTKEFHNFMGLPGELRNMVWQYALPERRVYEIMDVPHAKKKMKAVDGLMFANIHHEPPPALASVCQESRSLVMDHYRPLTLSTTTKYVDLSRDLLLLEPYLLLQRLHRTLDFMSRIPLIRDNMAGVALGTSYGVNAGIYHPVLSWRASKSNMVKLVAAMAKFPKLKSLLFVVHQEFQFEFDAVPDFGTTQANPSLLPTAAPFPVHPVPGPAVYSTHSYPIDMTGSQQPLPLSPLSPLSLPLPPPPAVALPLMRQLPLPPVLPYGAPLSLPHLSQPPLPAPAYPYPPPVIHQAQAFPAPQPPAPQAVRPQVVHQAYRFRFDVEGNINRSRRRPHLNMLLFYPLEGKNSEAQPVNWEDRVNDYNADGQADGGLTLAERAQMSDPWPTNRDWDLFYELFHKAVAEALRTGLAKNKGENAFCVAEGARADPSLGRAKPGSFRFGTGNNNITNTTTTTTNNNNNTPSSFDKKLQQHIEEQMCNRNDGSFNAGSNWSNNISTNTGNLHSLHGILGHGGVQKKKPAQRYKLKYVPPTVQGASLLWRYTRGA
ncbi:hypothetical protein SCUCBS95973_004254 [Sporothrix curviconia]|uniref:2EXR domain-containing protein n=1 Tax=Sporothrix curviconia TaxID=1260050 RepID=A0ABP0BM57_9PEZI